MTACVARKAALPAAPSRDDPKWITAAFVFLGVFSAGFSEKLRATG
jgi:hypothetical protein